MVKLLGSARIFLPLKVDGIEKIVLVTDFVILVVTVCRLVLIVISSFFQCLSF